MGHGLLLVIGIAVSASPPGRTTLTSSVHPTTGSKFDTSSSPTELFFPALML